MESAEIGCTSNPPRSKEKAWSASFASRKHLMDKVEFRVCAARADRRHRDRMLQAYKLVLLPVSIRKLRIAPDLDLGVGRA
jgi:hypothetical protein